jgi:transposase
MHLAHTAAIKQYERLKFSNDQVDARWLAHLLRLDILYLFDFEIILF